MDRRKVNSISRKSTISRRRAGVLNRADPLSRLCNIELIFLINFAAELPYVYGSPSSDEVVKHIQDPSASSSTKQTKILEYLAKLDYVMKELEENKEHDMVLGKKLKMTLESCNLKEIIDPTTKDLDILKKKLEDLKDVVNKKRKEQLASSPLIRLKDENNKKNKVALEFSGHEDI